MRLKDEIKRLPDMEKIFSLDPKRHRPAQTDAEKNGVKLAKECDDLVGVNPMVEPDVDADLADAGDLGESILGRDLVRRDAKRIEPTRNASRFKGNDLMPEPP